MTRKKRSILDIGPIVELFTKTLTEQLSRRIAPRLSEIEQRISRIEQATVQAAKQAPAPAKEQRPCSIDGCDRPVRAKGMCGAHYQQMRYHQQKDKEGKTVTPRSTVPSEPPSQEQVRDKSGIHPVIRKKQPDAVVVQADDRPIKTVLEHEADESATRHPGLRPIV